MKGILLLNKTKGKTSRDMVNELNHIFGTKKIGHTGTLDPIATGVLVICIGKYTKMVDILSSMQKEYIGVIKLGIKTDTLDITGNILEERTCSTTKEEIEKVLASLKGDLEQEIPLYSAKKIKGKKLYEYARENKEVKLPKNTIHIYNLKLLDYHDDEITFKALVSKGTYIRSLITIICDKLDVIGTMKELTRTKQQNFSINEAYTIEDIKKGNYQLLKAQDVTNFPQYLLNDEEYHKAINGNKLLINLEDEHIILIYEDSEIAIYKKEEEIYKPEIMLI